MNIYITFGQEHVHNVNNKIFNKDTIAKINCLSYGHGRKKAFKLFGSKFATSYTKEEIDNKLFLFSAGIIFVD